MKVFLTENIYLKKFAFILRAEEEITLPGYKGSVFRGAFGWAFRHTVCVTKASDCGGCILQDHCLYFRYFETEVREHSLPFLQGVTKIPHPFVIHPPLDTKKDYRKGSLIEVQLSLFGTASEYLPYFIHSFIKLGNEGLGVNRQKVSLQRVEAIAINNDRETVFSSAVGRIESTGNRITPSDLMNATPLTATSALKLRFLTPVRLQIDGKAVMNKTNITAELLIRNITRRCQAISHFYCGGSGEKPLLEDTRGIQTIENRLRFFDWNRYSNRQKTKMKMGGFTGSLTLSGIPEAVVPFLFAGSLLGIGKHTMFGMGHYVITEGSTAGDESKE